MMKISIKETRRSYQITLVLIFLALSFYKPCYAQDSGGVLVAAESSQVQKTSILEIRRIYLGLPPSLDNSIKKPVINLSDLKTYKAFLKNIMHMTEKGYQRKLIKRTFRQGGGKITEEGSIMGLVQHLEKNLHDVSFMDKDTAKKTKGVKVVQVLW